MLIFGVFVVHVGNAGDCIGRLAGAESGARGRAGTDTADPRNRHAARRYAGPGVRSCGMNLETSVIRFEPHLCRLRT